MSKIWVHNELIEAGSKTQFQIRLPEDNLKISGISVSALDYSIGNDKIFHFHRGSIWLRDINSAETFYVDEVKFAPRDNVLASPYFNPFTPYLGAPNVQQFKAYKNELKAVNSQLSSNLIEAYFESDVVSKVPYQLRIYLKIES